MAAISLSSSPVVIHNQKKRFFSTGQSKRQSGGLAFATMNGREDSFHHHHHHHRGGQMVDESMIVLRKRLHEMKMIERNYEPPAEWMEWEKQCYTSYDETICKMVGLLQSMLMNTRPSLSLGLLAIVTMSVPASTIMIVLRLLEVVNGGFSRIHIS